MSLTKKIKSNHFEGGSNLTQGGKSKKGESLAELVQNLEGEGQVLGLLSDAGAGGGASEVMVVPGLLATDQVLSVAQRVPGGNNLAIIGWSTPIAGALTGIWAADPGANARLDVVVKRIPLS